jgi:hypothetical protein
MKSGKVGGSFVLVVFLLTPVISLFIVNGSTLASDRVLIPDEFLRTTSINVSIIIDSTFDPTIDFESLLAAYEAKYSSKSPLQSRGEYILDLEYRDLTTQEHSDFLTYLRSTQHVGEPNGYEINSSITIPEEGDQFIIEKVGVAFNATDTILWLVDNLWNQKMNQYSLFLFNLTDVDIESGLPHWWLYEPFDIDTNSVPLELSFDDRGIDYSLTYGRQVPAWGGWRYPIHFIDLSAEQWMGEFFRTLNEPSNPLSWGDPLSSYNHLLKNLSDFSTPADVSDVAFLSWLETWINDYIFGIYRDAVSSYRFKVSENISVQNLVLNNWSEYQNNDEISWLVHDDLIDAEFSRAFPWIDFEVTTTWKKFSDFPSLEERIAKVIGFDTFDGTPELEIESTGFATYCQNTFFPSVFDYSAADLVLPSLIFLFDNMTLTHEGTRYIGYPFSSWSLMGLESSFVFRKDGVTPDIGLSSLILHEIGHCFGLRHPFDGRTASEEYQLGWGSVFTHTIMTYFHQVPDFSIYDTNAIGHATSDYYLAPAEWYASELMKISGINSSTSFVDALNLLHHAQDAQQDWNYSGAIPLAKEAHRLLKALYTENTATSNAGSYSPIVFILFYLICQVVIIRKYRKT